MMPPIRHATRDPVTGSTPLASLLLLVIPSILVACDAVEDSTPSTSRWTIDSRVDLPMNVELDPDDPQRPGDARPQGLAVHDGRVYTALTHLLRDPGWGTAGPGYLAVHDAVTLDELALVPLVLGGDRDGDEDEDARPVCRNAGDVLVTGETILVTCSGEFDSEDGALVEVVVTTDGPEVSRIVRTGGSPGALAASPSAVWMTDLASGSLLRVSLPEFEVLNGIGGDAPLALCPDRDHWEMISAVVLDGNRGFASCFNGGTVVEFDSETGIPSGEPLQVGDGPHAFAVSGDWLFVLDNLGSTLSRITLTRPPQSDRAILPLGQMPERIAAGGDLLAVTSGGDGTVTLIDATDLEKVDSIDLKPPRGGTPYPWGVAFGGDDTLFVALNGSNELVKLVRQSGDDE